MIKKMSSKQRSLTIGGVVFLLVLLCAIVSWILVSRSSAPEEIPKPSSVVRYNKTTDICADVDLSPLREMTGKVISSKPADYGGGNIACEIRLEALMQPDGELMAGSYRVEVAVDFASSEADKDIAVHRLSWHNIRKKGTQDETASSEFSTFKQLDDVFDDAYSVTRQFNGDTGALLAYMEHIISANVDLSVKLSGTLRGDITGEEFKPYVRQVIERTLKKLQK